MKLEWLSRSANWMVPGATVIALKSGLTYGNVVIYHEERSKKGYVKTALLETIKAMEAYEAKRNASQG